MGTYQTILWIDSDCYSLQNTFIDLNLNLRYNFNVERYNNIEDGINKIKSIKWQKVNVIIRGSMIRDLISAIEFNKKEIFCIIDMIVFTLHKEETKILCKTDDVISSSGYLFDNSNILVNLNDIIKYIDKKTYIEPEDFGTFGKFLKIDSYNQIIYPLFYKKLITPISKEEIQDFNTYLCNCFGNQVKKLILQLESNSNIPNEIICKYWARVYTFESGGFYKLMNKRLRQKKSKMFVPFIKMMYEGINNGVFITKQRGTQNEIQELFRGSKITINELNKIKKYIRNNNSNDENRLKCILYIRPFLSFSKNKETAQYFMKRSFLKKGEKRVLYILNVDSNDGDEISYAPMEEYSAISGEEEILFFPYSCFEVKEIREIDKLLFSYVEIKLGYIAKYKKNLESFYSNEENLDDVPNTEYEREISELGLISNNYKKYWKVVKEIKIDEGNVSCILYFEKGKFLFSVNHKIKFYDFVSNKNLQSIEYHKDDIIDLLKINEERFISSSKDHTIKLFNLYLNNFNLIISLESHKGQVNQVIKLNLSDYFVSCSDDKTIKFWKFDFKEKIYLNKLSNTDDEDIISIHELKKEYLVYISRRGNLKFLSKTNEKWNIFILKILENPLKNCFSVLNEDILILGTEKSIFLIDILQKIIIKKFPHQYQASSIGYLKENLLFGLKKESNLCLLNEFSIDDSTDNLDIECIGEGKDLCLEINQI